MKLVTGFVYFILVSVFFGSSCLLIIFVAGNCVVAATDPMVVAPAKKNNVTNDFVLVDINNTDLNSTNTDFSSSDLKEIGNGLLIDEISSSFDEIILSTVRDEASSKEFVPHAVPVRLKYTKPSLSQPIPPHLNTPVNQLSQVEGVIAGDTLSNVSTKKDIQSDSNHVGTEQMSDKSDTSSQIALDPGGQAGDNIVSSSHTPEPVGPTQSPDMVTIKSQTNETQQTEDIPSFSEWAKKQLKKAEKNKAENLTWGTQTGNGDSNNRKKNYASPDCGAKVVKSNPEAISPSALLSNNRDEYLLNPCTAKIWVVVELCEAIQPQRIELANFELFSSSPREISVYLSDNPSREWTEATSLTAKDERSIQSFPLPHLPQFVKFIKLELHSHYGTEHFCPLSLFRVYGTSEYEVLDSVEVGPHSVTPVESPEDNERDLTDVDPDIVEVEPKNLFGSAKAAVLSLVRRVAEVVVVKSSSQANSSCRDELTPQYKDHCITPSYLLVCDNCTDHFFYRLYNLVCCQQEMLKSLMSSSFVTSVLEKGTHCSKIGLDWTKSSTSNNNSKNNSDNINATHQVSNARNKLKTTPNNRSPETDYLSALLPAETIAALCNMMAVSRKKIVLNMTSLEEPLSQSNDQSVQTLINTESSVEDSTAASQTMSDVIMSTTPPLNNTLIDIKSTAKLPQTNSTVQVDYSNTLIHDPKITSQNNVENMNNSKASEDLSDNIAVVNATSIVSSQSQSVQTPQPSVAQTVSQLVTSTAEQGLDAVTLDSIFSVLEDDTEQNSVRATTAPQPKESVFVRLANRIKVLETNLLLSSEYLEALSLRYKKQVDELQKNLNSVMEEKRQSLEREAVLTSQVSALIERVDAITANIIERESWLSMLTTAGQHGIVIVMEICLFILVISMCKRLTNGYSTSGSLSMCSEKQTVDTVNKHNNNRRRKSLDDIHVINNGYNRRRRPSEEALTSAGATHNELLLPPNGKRKISRTEMRRKKKRNKEIQI